MKRKYPPYMKDFDLYLNEETQLTIQAEKMTTSTSGNFILLSTKGKTVAILSTANVRAVISRDEVKYGPSQS